MEKRNVYEIYYRMNFIILVACLCIMLLPGVAPLAVDLFSTGEVSEISFEILFIMEAIILAAFAPFLIYYGIQYFYYKRVKPTDIQTVKLEHIVSGYTRHAGFEIKATVNGKPEIFETKAIFAAGGLFPSLRIDMYINKNVTVGYNADRDEIIMYEV